MAESEPSEESDAAFEALWKRVLEAWDDPKTHNALLEYALKAQCLPDAAGRYRALKDDPEKGTIAKKRLDAIVIAATQMLMSTATPKAKPRTLGVLTAVTTIVAFAILIWVARLLLQMKP